ncbi:MAG: RidA family protein [Aromatoleum sp.]|jgi:enamine deaminase RidA (YjgF/YER057c/UK114 family)|uniref:RidA family protein n=1 Tax=Aromatoleum sp. TaxID=2307007 RepID=UPI002895726E|nr:RidA family protein [Aromatoleum sp.]MDT3669981.1 RidA family protein [Aromatoleum sp.]
MNIQRHGTTARYSDIVVHNGLAWIVEVPSSDAADAATQTGEILASLDALLARADSAPSRACVQVAGLANPAWRVEIAIVAAVR